MSKPAILIDSGFWFGLFDIRDECHNQANELLPYLYEYKLIIPWPVLYEVLNTRFIRRMTWIDRFYTFVTNMDIFFVDDGEYINNDLSDYYLAATRLKISLVDYIIRNMLNDRNLKIDFFVTGNVRDFQDICFDRDIELYNLKP